MMLFLIKRHEGKTLGLIQEHVCLRLLLSALYVCVCVCVQLK